MKSLKPIGSVQEELKLVDSFIGNPEDFELAVPAALLDAVGINTAIITDRILRRGWQPDGFTQESGFRRYLYREARLAIAHRLVKMASHTAYVGVHLLQEMDTIIPVR